MSERVCLTREQQTMVVGRLKLLERQFPGFGARTVEDVAAQVGLAAANGVNVREKYGDRLISLLTRHGLI